VRTASHLQRSSRPPSPLIHPVPLPTSSAPAEQGDGQPFGSPAKHEASASGLLAAGREVASEDEEKAEVSGRGTEDGGEEGTRGRLHAVSKSQQGGEESEGYKALHLGRRGSTSGEGMFRARSSSPVRVLQHRAVWPKQRTGPGDVEHKATPAVEDKSSDVAGSRGQGEVEKVYNGALM